MNGKTVGYSGMGALQSTGWLLLLLPLLLQAAEGVGYPANPAINDQAYFVAANGLRRIDRTTGKQQWRALEGSRVNSPVLVDGKVVVSSGRQLTVIDDVSGEIRWARDIAGEPFAPVVTGDRVYVATHDGSLMAFSLEQGNRLWQIRPGQGWLYPPAVQGGRLITGGQDGILWALDADSGAILWQRGLDQELVYAPLAVDDRLLIATTFSGAVTGLNGETGEPVWSRRFASPSQQPILAAGVLVVPGMDGVLRGLEPSTGRRRWEYASEARLLMPLSSHGDRLLVSTDEGEQLLLDGVSGALIKRRQLQGDWLGASLVSETRAAVFLMRRNEPAAGPVLVYVNDQPD